MAKTVHLQLTGEAEKLLNELAESGMSERQIIAKALGMLLIVHKTGRVALLKRGKLEEDIANVVEYVFTIHPVSQVFEEDKEHEQLERLREAVKRGEEVAGKRKSTGLLGLGEDFEESRLDPSELNLEE
jgi:adenine-specific DNA methylase